MIVSCSNDGRAILWNVQKNCKIEIQNFIIRISFFIAIFAELDVDNATPLTSIIAMNAQR